MKLGLTKIAIAMFLTIATTMPMGATVADAGCPMEVITVGPAYLVFEGGELTWIYMESNDMDGFQRGGTAIHGNEDTCYDVDAEGNPTGNYDTGVY